MLLTGAATILNRVMGVIQNSAAYFTALSKSMRLGFIVVGYMSDLLSNEAENAGEAGALLSASPDEAGALLFAGLAENVGDAGVLLPASPDEAGPLLPAGLAGEAGALLLAGLAENVSEAGALLLAGLAENVGALLPAGLRNAGDITISIGGGGGGIAAATTFFATVAAALLIVRAPFTKLSV